MARDRTGLGKAFETIVFPHAEQIRDVDHDLAARSARPLWRESGVRAL